MSTPTLLQLAQDLEWLGCELEYQGQKHAHEGFPGRGATWETFLHMRDGVEKTAEKVERELKASLSFNPTSVAGIEYPLEAAMDAIGVQLSALEDIKQTAESAVHDLPVKVRAFTRMVETYLRATGKL
ncbi:MAG: hypothetical protein ACE145_17010 [Terriglobia bacterium]